MFATKMLAFQRPDGGISLTTVAGEFFPDAPEDAPEGIPRSEAELLDMFEAKLRAPKINAEGGMTAVADGWIRLPDVDPTNLPTDRTFRNAWQADGGRVVPDTEKCRVIAHDIRRRKRDAEFAPHDEIIAKKIPGKGADDAEAARIAIRAKYDAVQTAIDAAGTVEEMKAALP